MPRWSWFSTTATWNWRGSRRMAKADKQRGDAPDGRIGRRLDHRGDVRVRQGRLGQIAEAAVQPPDDEGADREKRHELDDRLHRDRQDQPVLVLLRIDPPRAEGDGEGGEHQGDRQRERRADGVSGVSRDWAKDATTVISVVETALSCSAT